MKTEVIDIDLPKDTNVIIGQAHFIKTVEDLYEAFVTSVPAAKFGVAFSEASGPCLVRSEGNDAELKESAERAALSIGAGHVFVAFMKDAFPINVLGAIKSCDEVCSIFCATANPLQVVVAETEKGRGIMGVIDGSPPRTVEGSEDVKNRKSFLRRIGYKL
ncbi:MAG: adenosine-specific kinase [Candidatus Eisenbacteria bacterium]|nr:adenosine-specific kinase [Candidatus Eisenbacteria bacterium]